MGVSIETTNEVELIKEAKENQEIFLQIVNNVEDIIFIREEDKIIYINKAFEKIHGIKAEELNLYEDINGWVNHWDEVEIEKEFKPYEYNKTDTMFLKVTKDKEDRWFYGRYCPILDEDEKVLRKVCIVSDITNAKKLELQMEKLRMDFFANLSHELRTPLNLILSSYQVLKLRMNKLNSEEFEYFDRYLNIIKQNSYRLLKLINNLIDSTKLDSGSFTHNPKNRYIVRCVEDICMSVSEFIESNNLNLVFDTNVEEKIISFDQDNIERIMLNLLSNAIKFNKDNGIISVEISCEDNIKIMVKDNGIGIPCDKLEAVFGRFEQVRSKMNNNREGSGIGLSLVKSLVNMHDGDICVKSKLGEGSEFIITLPDVLIEGEESDVSEFNNNFKNITKMSVEFSDIYL
ncbi:PAS domain-containing sensor histidine kinase [Romboutsia sp. 1001713B170207_170306_H8]|uniref:PAS domain-containing sensor histidine kinase n=1 Tax=Romboutsia sp. 1001713B170207_170306_H8 TaxID=2787112 RepID=UPI0008234BE9|nr:ATP-binding protein [Romboutsia sp. 1001713B170207_170306_H8]SCH50116.1 Sensor histidine kinase YycG [uncultured Clostridium sp.]